MRIYIYIVICCFYENILNIFTLQTYAISSAMKLGDVSIMNKDGKYSTEFYNLARI